METNDCDRRKTVSEVKADLAKLAKRGSDEARASLIEAMAYLSELDELRCTSQNHAALCALVRNVAKEELGFSSAFIVDCVEALGMAARKHTERHRSEDDAKTREIMALREALSPFAAINPVVLSEYPETHAKHYWTVIGHPGKSHFTKEDLVLAKRVMHGKAV